MLSASLWVLIAFCILSFGLGKPAWQGLRRYLDEHALKIKTNLLEARRLHQEAETLLTEAKRLKVKMFHQTQEIISHAELQAEELKKLSLYELENYLRVEEKLLLERLTQIEAQALKEVENKALETALNVARQRLSEELTREDQTHLFDEMVDLIKSFSLKR